MKTQKNTLKYSKHSLVELTTPELNTVKGGVTTYVCSNCIPNPITDKITEVLAQ